MYCADAVGGLNEITHTERLGGNQYDAGGHIGQHALYGQRDSQGQHAQQGHQRRDGNAQPVSYNENGDQPQHETDSAEGVLADLRIHTGLVQQFAEDVEDHFNGDQADQQCERGTQDAFQCNSAQKSRRAVTAEAQGSEKFVHGKNTSEIRFAPIIAFLSRVDKSTPAAATPKNLLGMQKNLYIPGVMTYNKTIR